MAFTGLEDRFLANASTLYNFRSTRDDGNGGLNDQPFLEFKPDDPNAEQESNDTQSVPTGATARDITRITAFLKSKEGVLFLNTQTLLQTSNTFSETQTLNPSFILGNITPFLHLERPSLDASQMPLSGDTSQASNSNDGSAGRLQGSTATQAVSRVTLSNTGQSGLLSLLPPSGLTSTLTGVFNLQDNGILGVNQRPELDVNGDYFSIAMWKSYQKNGSFSSDLDVALQNLRVGNIINSVTDVVQAGEDLASQLFSSVVSPSLVSIDQRNQPTTSADGGRYFITSADSADRYLSNTVQFTTNAQGEEVPFVQASFLTPTPYIIPPPPDDQVGLTTPSFSGPTNFLSGLGSFLGNIQSTAQNIIKTATNAVRLPIAIGTQTIAGLTIPTISLTTGSIGSGGPDNPAEDAMLFPNLALRNRYLTDARVDFIRTQLQTQQNNQFAYWQTVTPANLGFTGGNLQIGAENNIDNTVRSGVTSYLQDNLNLFDITAPENVNKGQTQVPQALIDKLQQYYGKDLINIFVYDYVNGVTIPFRAFLMHVSENVTPEINDTRYIGRIDRNVVYVGVMREITFALKIHALSQNELPYVWKKINYMTGLCYPAKYDNGFMVPPLVKLTIGDVYRDQPGYIKILTNTIDDNEVWETETNYQAPHGITMQISFNVIEKKQISAYQQLISQQKLNGASLFYPVGFTRPSATQNNKLPSTTNSSNLTTVTNDIGGLNSFVG